MPCSLLKSVNQIDCAMKRVNCEICLKDDKITVYRSNLRKRNLLVKEGNEEQRKQIYKWQEWYVLGLFIL